MTNDSLNQKSYEFEMNLEDIIDDIPNQELKIFSILKKTSYSGSAVVKNKRLSDRKETLKVVRSYEPYTQEQFSKECQVLSALEHSNIPRIYDFIMHEGTLIMRSEYIDGYSLAEVIEYLKENKLSIPKSIIYSIIQKIAKALYYIHNEVYQNGKIKRMIHCDIKPSNIILRSKNYKRGSKVEAKFIDLLVQNKVEPYIIDFGISQYANKSTRLSGTLNYLSPQQVTDKPVDWKTDIFQLMLVFYEFLTYKKPYQNLEKKEIIKTKKSESFKPIGKNIPPLAKKIITNGTSREFFNDKKISESYFLRKLAQIHQTKAIQEYLQRNKIAIMSVVLTILIIIASYTGYMVWDKNTNSIDALVRSIQNNPDPTLEELESILEKIQTRGFEKKYLNPLIEGEFRSLDDGSPLYPSVVNSNGEWILENVNTNEAGEFIGMLFEQSEKFPEILPYAIEYAQPLVDSEFDHLSVKRFFSGLAPAYEITKDKQYLNKLIEIAKEVKVDLELMSGITQIADLHSAELFLWLYEQTNNKTYLVESDNIILQFIENNIDEDGYVYFFSQVNATMPDGTSIADEKFSRLIIPIEGENVGAYAFKSRNYGVDFKSSTSIFTREFGDILTIFEKAKVFSNSKIYDNTIDKIRNYYYLRTDLNKTDYLFMIKENNKLDIPKDSLATLKMINFFKKYNQTIYKNKLKKFITNENFKKEIENGITKGSVWFPTISYNHADNNIKNRALMQTDRIFLKI